MTYAELLKDPRWQRKRLEILQRDGWACTHCEAKDKTLHVDHAYYEKGKKPWEYPDKSLWTLCEDCHENMGSLRKWLQKELAGLSPCSLKVVIGFVQATHDEFGDKDRNLCVHSGEAAFGIGKAFYLHPDDVTQASKEGHVSSSMLYKMGQMPERKSSK